MSWPANGTELPAQKIAIYFRTNAHAFYETVHLEDNEKSGQEIQTILYM